MSLNQQGVGDDAKYLARASVAIVALDNLAITLDAYDRHIKMANEQREREIVYASENMTRSMRAILMSYSELDSPDDDDDDDDD